MKELKRYRVIWTCANLNCGGDFQYAKGDKPRFCPYCRGEQFEVPQSREDAE